MDQPDPRVRHIKYDCTVCGKSVGRDNLTVKRAYFTTMGSSFKTLRTRAVAWLCYECRDKDLDWNRERTAGAPGMANTKLHG